MTYIVTPEVRSRMMASITSRETKAEVAVRRYLRGRGSRYLHAAPDRKPQPVVLEPWG